MNWTDEQQAVIGSRGCSLLVSAAAGSGKTAVLTARILDRLMEEPHIDIDQMLIVTFTEAAAAEMRERIRNGVEEALKRDPDNRNLQRQSALVYCARITTIHSFCLSVVRENFHAVDLDPGFRIAEEGERKLLMHDVMDELLEEKYAGKSDSFVALVESVVTKREDTELEEQILRLYAFAEGHPDPEEWLLRTLLPYEAASPDEMARSGWFNERLGRIRTQLLESARTMERAIRIAGLPDGPGAYLPTLTEEAGMLCRAAKAEDYDDLRREVGRIYFGRMKAERGKNVDPEKKKRAADLRKKVKEKIVKLQKEQFGRSLREEWEDMKLCETPLRELVGLTKEFAVRFAQKKREQNVIDFSDMERFALRILTKKENGRRMPTAAADNYRNEFREIMIDEYQDSNLVQEEILRSVSGECRGQNNLFMVGDVKQSIYRFRLARPELFMEKYRSYPTEAGEATRRIDLHKNFRSRREVLDTANYIFRRIMHEDIGGVEYDRSAMLHYGASYEEAAETGTARGAAKAAWTAGAQAIGMPQTDGAAESPRISPYRSELLIVAENDRELEARAAAGKIRELVGRLPVTDPKTGKTRPCTYGDIAVLFRSVSGWSDIFSEVFEKEQIPTWVGSRTGYFQAKEIRMMLQYLKLLDNPRQDFPLTAALTSPMGGFDGEELAKIRLLDKKKPFYACVFQYREDGGDPKLQKKVAEFLSTYETLRREASWRPLHELLWRIVKATGLDIWMAARPDGAQKEANLSMLIRQAVRFETSSYKGVFHFVRYMEQLESYEIDYGEAETAGLADAVRFMSVHKSKGLEFPVVIVAGMGKKFNESDLNARLLLHADAGIASPAVDLKRRVRRTTAFGAYVRSRMKTDAVGEEIRVMYVALTRAKEKLILLGSDPKAAERMAECEGDIGTGIGYGDRLDCGSWLGLLYLALAATSEGEAPPLQVRIRTREELACDGTRDALGAYDTLAQIRTLLDSCSAADVPDDFLTGDMAAAFGYRYPHRKLQTYKMKFTVSELKMQHDVTEDGALLFREEEVIPLLPKFISGEETLGGAGRGSVYHRVMELLDFGTAKDAADVARALSQLVRDGYLTEKEAACVRLADVAAFLHSPVGARMRRAAEKGKLYREQPFVIGVPASEVYGRDAEEETILVQGIIDVYFEEEDGIVVLDYKTDRVSCAQDLKRKYEKQLEYYAEALTRLHHLPVKEKIIYSFTLQEEIVWR